MAVNIWVYGNAKIQGDRGDYFVRACGQAFLPYKDRMIRLSNRLLAVERRRGEAARLQSWFAGYLDEQAKLYVVAVAGEQESLLGAPLYDSGFRALFCVLAYGLTGEDIRLLRKDDGMFLPQKEILKAVSGLAAGRGEEAGLKETVPPKEAVIPGGYEERTSGENRPLLKYNLVPDTPETEKKLWPLSMDRPVMTGILSMEDGRRLIGMFPGGIAAVRNGAWEYAGSRPAQNTKILDELRQEETARSKAGQDTGYGRRSSEENGGGKISRGGKWETGRPDGRVASKENFGEKKPAGKNGIFLALLLMAVLAAGLILWAACGTRENGKTRQETEFLTETKDAVLSARTEEWYGDRGETCQRDL